MTTHVDPATRIPHIKDLRNTQSPLRWAFDQNQLKPVHRCVLIALADYADTSREVIVHRRKLAEWAGIHVDTVGNALNELKEQDLIAVFNRFQPDGGQTASKYVLNIR